MASETMREKLQKQLKNFTALMTSEVLNKATTLVIYGLVARNLSAKEFGQLSLGLMLFYTFQVIATAGLPTIITRCIAQRGRRTESYCSNGVATALLSGFLSMLAMCLITLVLRYEWDATVVICCLSLGLIPHGMAIVIESVFRGRERMHFVAVANVIANVVKLGGAFVLFRFGYGILSITLLLLSVRWLIFLINWGCYVCYVRQRKSRIKWMFVVGLFRRSVTFLGIDVIIAVWATIDALILSKLATEVEVGLFSAACQLLQPLMLVYRSAVAAIFPSMCVRAKNNASELLRVSKYAILMLLTLGTPLIVVLYAFPVFFLEICYGESDIRQAAVLLQIVSGILVFQAFTNVLGNVFWASSQERVALKIVVVNLCVSTGLGLLFIWQFGVLGAAISVLVVSAIDMLQHWVVAARFFRERILQPVMGLPILGGMMILAIVESTEYKFIALIIGCGIYAMAGGLALLWVYQARRQAFEQPAASA